MRLHVNKRKNDRVRRGHYPALGQAEDPELDIVHQLRVWMEAMDLAVHPRCRKRREPAARPGGALGALRSYRERGAGDAT